MGTNNGGVNHGVFVVRIFGKHLEHPLPYPRFCPAPKAGVNLAKMTKSLWQVAPGNACSISIQHRFDKQPIILCRHSD